MNHLASSASREAKELPTTYLLTFCPMAVLSFAFPFFYFLSSIPNRLSTYGSKLNTGWPSIIQQSIFRFLQYSGMNFIAQYQFCCCWETFLNFFINCRTVVILLQYIQHIQSQGTFKKSSSPKVPWLLDYRWLTCTKIPPIYQFGQ